GYESGLELVRAIQLGESQADIFIVSAGYMDFANIIEKEYALPLSQSEVLKEKVGEMYPYVQKSIMKNGEIYGVPVGVDVVFEYGYVADIWKEAGLTEEDAPKTLMEFLDFVERWVVELEDENPDILLFGFGSNRVAKENLASMVLDAYANYYAFKGEVLDFDTPLFRKMMEKIEQMDIPIRPKEMDKEEEDEMFNKPGLFFLYGGSVLTHGTFEQHEVPLLLPLDEGMEPVSKAMTQIAFINPGTENQELALAYLETLVTHYRNEEKVLIYTQENQPIKNPDYDRIVESMEKEIQNYQQQLEKAPEDEKQQLQETIEALQKHLERSNEELYWQVSQKGIDQFEWLLPSIYISTQNLIYNPADQEGNVYKLLSDYVGGAISLDQLISEANRRVQMAAMERQ
ncbi:MAG: hypothetical protein GX786_01545, partial [Clostridiales bacterium]|nr:hypothetical protein [Clostridiales bacterium]